jgi:hypothetical protein
MTSTDTLRRATLWTVLGLVIVPIALAIALSIWQSPPVWGAVGLGTAGWLVAFLLRGPVAAAVAKLPRERGATILAASSGPCEEIVRLLLVLFLVSGFPSALWAGFGWAAIEIVYALVNTLVVHSLLGKTDEKSLEVRRMLEAQGSLRTDGPLWAAAERVSASLLHIGFTLLLAWQPWLALATVPLHSGANLLTVRLMRRSLPLAETVLAVVGVAAFAFGLAVSV